MKREIKIGILGRFKPLHKGSLILLKEALKKADKLIIGIGSSNIHNYRNPFSAFESAEMIKLSLKKENYRIVYFDDNKDISIWRSGIINKFGNIDYLISGNPYVKELLKDTYKILEPSGIINKEKMLKINSSTIRFNMVIGKEWKKYLPDTVTKYIEKNKIAERIKKEFGKEIIEKSFTKFEKTTQEEKRLNEDY